MPSLDRAAKTWQLARHLGQVGQGQRRQFVTRQQGRQFHRVGRHHVIARSPGIGQLGTQHLVRADNGDLHLHTMARLESLHPVWISVTWPGEYAQHWHGRVRRVAPQRGLRCTDQHRTPQQSMAG